MIPRPGSAGLCPQGACTSQSAPARATWFAKCLNYDRRLASIIDEV